MVRIRFSLQQENFQANPVDSLFFWRDKCYACNAKSKLTFLLRIAENALWATNQAAAPFYNMLLPCGCLDNSGNNRLHILKATKRRQLLALGRFYLLLFSSQCCTLVKVTSCTSGITVYRPDADS